MFRRYYRISLNTTKKIMKQQIYYSGTPSCQRYGSSTRIFDDFTGQICEWFEHPLNKKHDYFHITPMSKVELYITILENNLLEQLSPEGLNKYYAYESPIKQQ